MTRTVRQLAALARYPLQRKRTFIALLVIAMLTTGLLVRYADALYWLFKYGSGIIEVIAQDIGNALTTEILWNNAGTVDGISTFTTNGSTVTGTGTLNMSGGTVSLPSGAVDALSEVADGIQSATDANSTDFAMVGSGFTGSNQCVQRNANGALETTGFACGEGGGGGTPGGSDTELQYNDGGSFDGISGFTSDGTDITGTGDFTTSGTVTVGALEVEPAAIPTIPLRDADLIASDKTIAEITGNATDTGDGTEDADVTVAAMRAGVMTDRILIDGDGATTIPFLALQRGTIAQMEAIAGPGVGMLFEVNDGATPGDCGTGTGTDTHWCRYNGTAWEFFVGDTADFRSAIFGAEIDCSDTPGDVQIGIQTDGTPLCGAAPAGLWTSASAVILEPSGTHDCVRVSTDIDGPLLCKVSAGVFGLDIDGDGNGTTDFECTFTFNDPDTDIDCGGTDIVLRPKGAGGDIILQDQAQTACLTVDPDNGAITQGTNCQTLTYSHNIVVAGTLSSRKSVTTGTSDTVTLTQNGDVRVFNNDTADALTVNLAAASAGDEVCVANMNGATEVITVNPENSDRITLDDGSALTLLAAGVSVVSGGTERDAACFTAVDGTFWRMWNPAGTWAPGS